MKTHMNMSSVIWRQFDGIWVKLRSTSRYAFLLNFKTDKFVTGPYTVKTNALKKRAVVLILKNHISPNIFIFKTCHLSIDTGGNIYLGELSVGRRTSISSLSFRMICAVVTLQHVEKCFQIDVFN